MAAEETARQELLHGLGIGDAGYRGRACAVRDGADAIAQLQRETS